MSRVDELRAIVEIHEARAMRVAEEYAHQHDVVARLRQRLFFAEGELETLRVASEQAELAHREASRDLELEVDQEEDGAYGDDAMIVMAGIFGPGRDGNVDLWA